MQHFLKICCQTHYLFFSKSLTCDDVSCVIIPPPLLEYYESKVQWHIVFVFFHRKQLLKCRGTMYIKIQIFVTAYMYYVEAVTKDTRIAEENVDIYDTNQTF